MPIFQNVKYDHYGANHHAVHISWKSVREILGHEYGLRENARAQWLDVYGFYDQDDGDICWWLMQQEKAPLWIEDADEPITEDGEPWGGWIDEDGWGLIGPLVDTSHLYHVCMFTPETHCNLKQASFETEEEARQFLQDKANQLVEVRGVSRLLHQELEARIWHQGEDGSEVEDACAPVPYFARF